LTLRFLLDTNVLSEAVRPEPDAATLKRLRRHDGELATCAPVWHELVFGVSRLAASRRRRALDRYLQEVVLATLPILPYDTAAALWHGRERARLERKGLAPSFVDGQIAAIARAHELTLVSRNAGDFRRFEGLVVADWTRPGR
jgi:tRNA(fMet)-specific endonuclease VapC